MPQPTMPRPALTATEPRQLVHRAAAAETFLTGWERTGPDRFALFAQWPRAHRLHVSPDRSPCGDVVPTPPGRWNLQVDTVHPVFFDSLDRVPGMPLQAAARRAAPGRAVGPTGGGSFDALVHHYAELDGPPWIEVTDEAGTGVEVRGLHGESTVFECEVDAAAR